MLSSIYVSRSITYYIYYLSMIHVLLPIHDTFDFYTDARLFHQCRITPQSSAAMSRALFGLTRVYNHLPGRIVSAPTVKLFQRKLQDTLKDAARRGQRNWQGVFKHPLGLS